MSEDASPHKSNRNGAISDERRLRRLAVEVAAQLPEDVADARAVLDYARELVEKFLALEDAAPAPKDGRLRVVG